MADDYSPYLENVLSDEDRELFREAVTAARGGAMRAAYIMVWLSCAESLKRKFRELAPRDHLAGKILGQIENKEANEAAVDVYVLDHARDYGLISGAEHVQLRQVYEMRCVYGHPYEVAPQKEALVAAMAAVVHAALARPTRLRHAFIDSQVDLLTTHATYLDDTYEAVAEYAREIYPRVADDLHCYFIKKLWRALDVIKADASVALQRRRAIMFSIAYLRKAAPCVLANQELASDIHEYTLVGALVLAYPEFWPHLSQHVQDMLVGAIIENMTSRPRLLKQLAQLHESGTCTPRQSERFLEAARMATGRLTIRLISAGVHIKYSVDGLVKALKSHNWYVQNPAAQAITMAGPSQVGDLTYALQVELGRNILQAAHGGAGEPIALLNRLAAEKGEEWPAPFIEGIIAECFVNETGEVRFKLDREGNDLLVLGRLAADVARRILDTVALGIVNRSSCRQYGFKVTRANALAMIDEASEQLPELREKLDALRVVVAELEPTVPD